MRESETPNEQRPEKCVVRSFVRFDNPGQQPRVGGGGIQNIQFYSTKNDQRQFTTQKTHSLFITRSVVGSFWLLFDIIGLSSATAVAAAAATAAALFCCSTFVAVFDPDAAVVTSVRGRVLCVKKIHRLLFAVCRRRRHTSVHNRHVTCTIKRAQQEFCVLLFTVFSLFIFKHENRTKKNGEKKRIIESHTTTTTTTIKEKTV